jgi:hypothetical protein
LQCGSGWGLRAQGDALRMGCQSRF